MRARKSHASSTLNRQESNVNISGATYGVSQDLSLNQSFQSAINSAPTFSVNPSLYGGSSGSVNFSTPSSALGSMLTTSNPVNAPQFAGLLGSKTPLAASTSSSALGGTVVPTVSQPAVSPFAGSVFKDISASISSSAPANNYPAKGFSIFATSLVDPTTGITKDLATPQQNRLYSPNIVGFTKDFALNKSGTLTGSVGFNVLPHFFDRSSGGPTFGLSFAPKNGPSFSLRGELDGPLSNLSTGNGLTFVGNASASFPFLRDNKLFPNGRLTVNPGLDVVYSGLTNPGSQQSATYTPTLGINYQLTPNLSLNLNGNAVLTSAPAGRPEGTVSIGVSGSF
jgi:hypothetical protein